MKQLGLNAPVYATEPVYKLGLLTMYEQFLSRKQISEFDLFTLDDIDSAFHVMTRLTYSENHHLIGKGEGIAIAPHVAGHLLGGTMWKITKDGEDVIYAVDSIHRKERHLNGTVLSSFVRPAVLITDAYHALNNQPYRRGEKVNEFGETIKKTLGAGGNVLLPVDTAGRVLELILTLEQYWMDKSLNYPIFLLTYVASSTIDYVKSFLEWMSDSIAKSFEQNRENPFLLIHVRFCISKSELDNAPDGPKSASLVRILQADPPPKAVKVAMSKRVPLVGDGLMGPAPLPFGILMLPPVFISMSDTWQMTHPKVAVIMLER